MVNSKSEYNIICTDTIESISNIIMDYVMESPPLPIYRPYIQLHRIMTTNKYRKPCILNRESDAEFEQRNNKMKKENEELKNKYEKNKLDYFRIHVVGSSIPTSSRL